MFVRLVEKGWGLAQKTGTFVPFTYWWLVWRAIDRQAESILDIGCADGDMMAFINHRRRFYTIGVDIFKPYLEEAEKAGRHSDYVLTDARRLPFKAKTFDTVLFLETIEHLEREKGIEAIEEVERIARKQVIISTPVVIARQEAYSGNPNQEHRAFWSPDEMRRRGYTVRGTGLFENWLVERVRSGILKFADKVIAGERHSANNEIRSISHAFKLADFLLRLPYYFIPGPVVYFLPRFAGHMVCVKRLNASRGTQQGDS